MTAIANRVLTESEARSLTDEVRADAQALWEKCLQLYEGEAHLALGYSSWGAYWNKEFGQHKVTGYRLLEAAKTARALNGSVAHGQLNERQARELARVPEEHRADVWETVQESGEVTAKAIRETALQIVDVSGTDEARCLVGDAEIVEVTRICPHCGQEIPNGWRMPK